MLSYQHAFHAGNHADVLKHATLCLLLDRLAEKEKPFCVIDGYAGRAAYRLSAPEAGKTGEWRDGIGTLSGNAVRSRGLTALLDAVEAAGRGQYPGSPAISLSRLRADDRLVCLELHPTEHAALLGWARRDRRVQVHRRDALEGLPALVPPPIRRGLVLIDPPYERKTDYRKVPEMLVRCVRRWATGLFALWYPVLPEARHAEMIDELARRLGSSHGVLLAEIDGRAVERGMIGSGLVIVNPPFRIEEPLSQLCAEIVALGLGGHTGWRVERVGGAYAGRRRRSGGTRA